MTLHLLGALIQKFVHPLEHFDQEVDLVVGVFPELFIKRDDRLFIDLLVFFVNVSADIRKL